MELFRNVNILLIESNNEEAQSICKFLNNSETEDYHVRHEKNLESAVTALESTKVDIILLNLFLEDSFGVETFTNLKEHCKETPVLVLTSQHEDIIGKSAVHHGAQDYLIEDEITEATLKRSILYAIERKRAERKIQSTEEKYRDLFLRSKDAIYMSTIEGEFIDINPSGLSLFGYEESDIKSLKVSDLYENPNDRIALIQELNEHGEIEDYEIKLIKKDQQTVLTCILNTIVIYGSQKSILGFQGIIKDVTAKKNAEEALFRSLRDLDQANKELQFLNVTLENKVDDRTAELRKKMDLVANQHKEITESINYAKRIQASILPPQRKVNAHLKDCFIYYAPKDIVSGDFYWFNTSGDFVSLAIVDCTGHGVPGAFMSIIGYTQLNEIFNDTKDLDLGEVLRDLDKRVIQALNQNGNDKNSKDGMELGIISWNKKTNEIQYSGAMRPLYFVQEGELKVIKGNKFAIGGHSLKNKEFATTRIQAKPGDCMYLFSDGYPDQFGGPKGKKFMTKNVSEMINKISHLEMKEQGAIVEQAIRSWMNGEEQIDDILMAGIRI